MPERPQSTPVTAVDASMLAKHAQMQVPRRLPDGTTELRPAPHIDQLSEIRRRIERQIGGVPQRFTSTDNALLLDAAIRISTDAGSLVDGDDTDPASPEDLRTFRRLHRHANGLWELSTRMPSLWPTKE